MDIRERMEYFRRLYEEIHAEDLQRQAKARARSRRLQVPKAKPGEGSYYDYQKQYREKNRDRLRDYQREYRRQWRAAHKI